MTIEEILAGESKNVEFKENLPEKSIRELIINAMVHRSYLDHGTIQVAVYDNRSKIEVVAVNAPETGFDVLKDRGIVGQVQPGFVDGGERH